MKFILASASPRRLDLLRQIDIEPTVSVSDFSEIEASKSPKDLVSHNALGKGKDILEKFSKNEVIIAADTIVVYENKILGKPKDEKEAAEMLKLLSGKTHEVLTAVVVLFKGKTKVKVEKTKVKFRNLTDEEIKSYVATGEPLDKAGAYGIQGKGALLVKEIKGSYSNVVGLPLTSLYELFLKLKIILQ